MGGACVVAVAGVLVGGMGVSVGGGVIEGVEEGIKYVAVMVNVGVRVGVGVMVGVKTVAVGVYRVGVAVNCTGPEVIVGVGVTVFAAMAALPTQSTTNPRR